MMKILKKVVINLKKIQITLANEGIEVSVHFKA